MDERMYEQNQPSYKSETSYQNQPMNQGQPMYQNQPMNQGQPMYQNQPMYQGQQVYQGQQMYQGQPPYQRQWSNQGQPPYHGQPMNQGRPVYQGQPTYQRYNATNGNPTYCYNIGTVQNMKSPEQLRYEYENYQRYLERNKEKKQISRLSRVLLYYILIMSVPSIVYCFFKILAVTMEYYDSALLEAKLNEVIDSITNNGWLYLIGIALGLGVLLIYRRTKLFTEDVIGRRKPMKFLTFLILVVVLFVPQTFSSLFSLGLDQIFDLLGISSNDTLDTLFSSNNMPISMYLYVIVFGPIMEEILFRGVVLHRLERYGRVFAIVATSFCFGLFHGNLTQGIFAFLVGLLLGYVALEYSVKWAMALHIINNGVAMLLDVLANQLPDIDMELFSFLGFAVLAVIGIAILIVKKAQIKAYISQHPTVPGSKRLVYGNAWFIVMICFFGVSILIYWVGLFSV